ncbi:hypothetical protein M1N19_02300 [Dehalococcoidia bacterium]|nr:hypothetical protein [Dehalococcoidia bacterium]
MEAVLKQPTKRAMLRRTVLHRSPLTWTIIGLLSMILLLHTQALASSFVNYLSTKTIERAPNTQLVIGREGVANPSLNVVMGPQVATLTPTGVRGTQATLRGELLDLRGFPQATIWFEWGYSDTTETSVIGIQTVSTTGIYSYTLRVQNFMYSSMWTPGCTKRIIHITGRTEKRRQY